MIEDNAEEVKGPYAQLMNNERETDAVVDENGQLAVDIDAPP